MRLYHFTGLEYLEGILAEGLTRGDVPLSPTKQANAVWLTSDPDPNAQGWAGEPHVLSDGERLLYGKLFGQVPPPGSRQADKRALILAVEVPDGDEGLIGWSRFARLHAINRRWRAALERDAGGAAGAGSWYLYRGAIPREWIVGIVPLSDAARAAFESAGVVREGTS